MQRVTMQLNVVSWEILSEASFRAWVAAMSSALMFVHLSAMGRETNTKYASVWGEDHNAAPPT